MFPPPIPIYSSWDQQGGTDIRARRNNPVISPSLLKLKVLWRSLGLWSMRRRSLQNDQCWSHHWRSYQCWTQKIMGGWLYCKGNDREDFWRPQAALRLSWSAGDYRRRIAKEKEESELVEAFLQVCYSQATMSCARESLPSPSDLPIWKKLVSYFILQHY